MKLPLPLHRSVAVFCLVSASLYSSVCVAATAFTFNDVATRAKQLAAESYKKPSSNLPKELQGLTYDRYRDIRYKPSESYWRKAKLPFELAFFHQGLYFEQPIKINEISPAEGVRQIPFDAKLFDYGANKFSPDKLRYLGFSGFRAYYPLNTPAYKDEVLVFLGASYFRALGKAQLYGISARGLAIDTAESSGEEFPRFVEFWIERPAASDKKLTIYALLDSPRMTGAYRFIVKPGVETLVEVNAQLHPRDKIGKVGLAPLTSMFFLGENQNPISDEYRPEVHDSDGLSIQ